VPTSGRDVAFSAIQGAQIVGSAVATLEAGVASVLVRVTGPRAGVAAQAQLGALTGSLER